MSDEIFNKLKAIAVSEKPTTTATAKKTPVDGFLKTAHFQIAKATAVSEEKSSFEIDGKSYDTSETRSDWFKWDAAGKQFWVQFGYLNPISVNLDKVPLVHMRGKDIGHVIEILQLGVELAQTDERFQKRILDAHEGRKRKNKTVQAEEAPKKRTRGPNKPKS